MKAFAWNYKGLGCTSTAQRCKQLLRKHDPNFVLLLETLKPIQDVAKLLNREKYGNVLGLDAKRHMGGVVLAWKGGLHINPL